MSIVFPVDPEGARCPALTIGPRAHTFSEIIGEGLSGRPGGGDFFCTRCLVIIDAGGEIIANEPALRLAFGEE
jgi:hypothetical protein